MPLPKISGLPVRPGRAALARNLADSELEAGRARWPASGPGTLIRPARAACNVNTPRRSAGGLRCAGAAAASLSVTPEHSTLHGPPARAGRCRRRLLRCQCQWRWAAMALGGPGVALASAKLPVGSSHPGLGGPMPTRTRRARATRFQVRLTTAANYW
jgi:hypothetical protein